MEQFVCVEENDYITDLDEVILATKHSYYPVVNNDNKSYVIEYKNGEERRIKLNDEVIKNNRKIVKRNIILATFEDLKFVKE